MNERQQLTLESISLRIEWLEAWYPTWQSDRRGMADLYGFSLFREVMDVHDRGCRLKFANIYGSPPEVDRDRARFSRDIDTLERAGLLVVTCAGRIRLARCVPGIIPAPTVILND